MARLTRSDSPSGTFGRRSSLLQSSSADGADGDVPPSATNETEQAPRARAPESRSNSDSRSPSHNDAQDIQTPTTSRAHWQSGSSRSDSTPASEGDALATGADTTPTDLRPHQRSSSPEHVQQQDPQDTRGTRDRPETSYAFPSSSSSSYLRHTTPRKGYGIGERGGADSILPLKRTLSPDGQKRQDAERALLLEQQRGDDATPRRSHNFAGNDERIPSPTGTAPQMDDGRGNFRQSVLSEATITGVGSSTGNNKRHSLKFLTPTDNDPNQEISDTLTARPDHTASRRSRARSTPWDAYRQSSSQSNGRFSISPIDADRRRHRSLQAFSTDLPFPPPFSLTRDSSRSRQSIGDRDRMRSPSDITSQSAGYTDPHHTQLRNHPWRPSAATNFSGHQDAKDFIARQRKMSDVYSTALDALEPRLPKQAVRSSDADPLISHTRSQRFRSSLERTLVPMRLVIPFLATFFFDFNSLFILAEIAMYGDGPLLGDGNNQRAPWWIAFGIYAASLVLHVALFAHLVARAYTQQSDPARALAVPAYLSLYGRLLMIMRKDSLQHFVRAIDREVTKKQRLIESAWRWRQAWPMEAVQFPRLLIAVVYVVVYARNHSFSPVNEERPSQRDPFFFDQDTGALSSYAFGVTLANIAWLTVNVLVVLSAAIVVGLTRSTATVDDDEQDEDGIYDAHLGAATHRKYAWQNNTRDRVCLALLELESATALDPMNTLPVHSAHGYTVGRGASMSARDVSHSQGESLDARIKGDTERSNARTPVEMSGYFSKTDGVRTKGMVSTKPAAAMTAPMMGPDLTAESNTLLPRTAMVRSESALGGANAEDAAGQDSNDSDLPRPSRSYVSHPLLVGSPHREEWHGITAPDPVPTTAYPYAPAGDGTGDASSPPHSPTPNTMSWPARIAALRTAGSFTRKKRRSHEDFGDNHGELEAPMPPDLPTNSNDTPSSPLPSPLLTTSPFWSGWFGSRGRTRANSASKAYRERGQRETATAALEMEMTAAATAAAAGPQNGVATEAARVQDSHAPVRHQPAIDAEQSTAVTDTTENVTAGADVAAKADESISSHSSGASSDDSEERRLWATFPEQSRRYPPGLIALELQEGLRHSGNGTGTGTGSALGSTPVEGPTMTSHAGGDADFESAGVNASAPTTSTYTPTSTTDENVPSSSDSSDGDERAHELLRAFARSPSEGGLTIIREESSNFGDGSSMAGRSTLSRNQSVGSRFAGAGGSGGTGSDEGGRGGGVSASNSAGSGLAAVHEREGQRGGAVV